MANENYYGVQKTPETKVRGGAEMGTGVIGGMGTGAQLGMKTGNPYLTAIGAVAGGMISASAQVSGRAAEKRQADAEGSRNMFIEDLQKQKGSQYEYIGVQAKKGLKARYDSKVEVESLNGIGEIVLDKNKNIKYVSTGDKPHTEGGDKLPFTLKKGDSVIPTQGDTKAQEKVLSLVKRFKIKGDRMAGKELDNIIDKLPSEEDYGYEEGETKKFYAGRGGERPKGIDDPNSEMYIGRYYTKDSTPQVPQEVGQNLIGAKPNLNSTAPTSTSINTKPLGANITSKAGFGKDYTGNAYQMNNESGEVSYIKKGKDKYEMANPDEATAIKRNIFGVKPHIEQNLSSQGLSTSSVPNTTSITTKPSTSDYSGINPETGNRYTSLEEYQGVDKTYSSIPTMKNRQDPTKYASAISNMIQGAAPAERTERRSYTPNDMRYKDMSAEQRAAIVEQRNASLGSLRGRGLSAGQEQAYASQIGAQAIRESGKVNALEAQRYDQVNNANIQSRNQAGAMNTQMAARYDEIDAQNRAAKQAYTDQGIKDISQFGQVNENKRYMMDRDAKAYAMQDKALDLTGSEHFKIENKENWGNVVYKQDEATGEYKPTEKVHKVGDEILTEDGKRFRFTGKSGIGGWEEVKQ